MKFFKLLFVLTLSNILAEESSSLIIDCEKNLSSVDDYSNESQCSHDFFEWLVYFIKSPLFLDHLKRISLDSIEGLVNNKLSSSIKLNLPTVRKENPSIQLNLSIMDFAIVFITLSNNKLNVIASEKKIETIIKEVMTKIYSYHLKSVASLRSKKLLSSCYADLAFINSNNQFEALKLQVDDLTESISLLDEEISDVKMELHNAWNYDFSVVELSLNDIMSFFNEFNDTNSIEIQEKISEIESLKLSQSLMILSLFDFTINLSSKNDSSSKLSYGISINPFNVIKIFTSPSRVKSEIMDKDFMMIDKYFVNKKNKRNVLKKFSQAKRLKQKYTLAYNKLYEKSNNLDKINHVKIKIEYIEACIAYFESLESLLEAVLLYKKENGDLIYNYRKIIGRCV